jgi:S-adenosylmethionine hydrolase
MAIISLITDFGLQDEYVGLMKAVILGIDPAAVVVDVSHAIDAQDVVQAAFLLEAGFRHFPAGSIHLTVVDPGVGSDRALIYAEAHGRRFLAADNGVLSLVLDSPGPATIRRLERPPAGGDRISATFHGRDILAPCAGCLSKGMDAREWGPELDRSALTLLTGLRAERLADGGIAGRVVHIDRFGNLITNVPAALLPPPGAMAATPPVVIRLAGRWISGLRRTYADEAAGRPLALVGSRGYLEIAVNRGSAQSHFEARKGDSVDVRPAGRTAS